MCITPQDRFLHRQEKLESLNITLLKIMMSDYEKNHYDKDLLSQSAVNLGTLDVPVTDLEQVRVIINKYCEELPDSPRLSSDWCFIDCKFRYFFDRMKSIFSPSCSTLQPARRNDSSGWTGRRRISTSSPTSRRIVFSCWIRNFPPCPRRRKTRAVGAISRGTMDRRYPPI